MDEKKWARRWAAYKSNVALLSLGLLLAWRAVPEQAQQVWRGLRVYGADILWLLLMLVGPLLALLSPLLAAWGVVSEERAAARSAAKQRRPLRRAPEPDEHETHCGCSDCL